MEKSKKIRFEKNFSSDNLRSLRKISEKKKQGFKVFEKENEKTISISEIQSKSEMSKKIKSILTEKEKNLSKNIFSTYSEYCDDSKNIISKYKENYEVFNLIININIKNI